MLLLFETRNAQPLKLEPAVVRSGMQNIIQTIHAPICMLRGGTDVGTDRQEQEAECPVILKV